MEDTNEVRIGRYLSGEAASEERSMFEHELESNPALKNDFLTYRKIWETSLPDTQQSWDSTGAWQRFAATSLPGRKEISITRRLNFKWAVAAVLLIALASFVLFWNNGKPVSYAYNEKATGPIVLSDGSKIYLNTGSTVDVYPFKNKKRQVALHGEAFFEVNPVPNQPFTVKCGGTITEVVGTAFNISETKENTRIYVQRGKVIFKSVNKIKEAVALTAGEAALYDEDRMQLIPNPSPNINAWHTRNLNFPKNMTIAEIIADASRYFNMTILLENNKLKDCRIGAALVYNNPDINAVIKPLASFINGSIIMEGNKCSILGGNCP